MDEREVEIVNFILARRKTHYGDIATHMNLSQRTIAKILDQIEVEIGKEDVQLVRRPNDGIYFTGKVNQLRQSLVNNYDSSP
ncbi:helix-turn-helix domain-containing protein [Pediococcus siamensis]|uniref:helix-turn-helix domain-containing protein n=1 Tax=Pediococcus siamensis TaxID=381829 RepID=UPI0039A0E452